MPILSLKSRNILYTCSLNLQEVIRESIKSGPDFAVISGRRTPEEQAEKVRLGYSKTMNSRHVATPPAQAFAVDIGPYIPGWGIITGNQSQLEALAKEYNFSIEGIRMRVWKQYGVVAGWILKTANELEIPLIWGGDWDRDWNALENSFEDLGHFEEPIDED
jgi:peptidoglycan LD-endopeptidase CwlK